MPDIGFSPTLQRGYNNMNYNVNRQQVADQSAKPAYDWATLVPQFMTQAWGRTSDKEVSDWTKFASENNLTPDQLLLVMQESSPETLAWAREQNIRAQPPQMEDRRAYLNSPEYINGLLGPATGGNWQNTARQASFGINAMPGVFSDYANPQMATHQIGDPRSQGNVMIQGLLANLMGSFDPVRDKAAAGMQGLLGRLQGNEQRQA